MKISFNHENVSTSTTVNDRVLNKCFLLKDTTKEVIHLKAFQVESASISFSVTYQKNVEIRHENLHGHVFKAALESPNPVLKREYHIPKQFLVSQETCLHHVMIVLSEMHLPPPTQERIISYISTESVNFSSRHGGRGRGLKVEVNVKVNVDRWVRIGCCNNVVGCQVPARRVNRTETEMNCPICLTDLSSAVSRMELRCSHVFHRDCLMKWLKKNPSCPICRTKTLGETVYLY
ncbi:unnamed protein product [Thlaspi arvense]|uniref:RING-type E3 ubiquitin transferase n=1 Tax=Thlaspi arvense TaxID=13288 RepID=A0AAU9SNA4_THLAR|nr:unnamed protein product [Thlaspi arvense]